MKAKRGRVSHLVRVARIRVPYKLVADPGVLRDMAGGEKNPRIRKHMLALAIMAEGHSAATASVRTNVDHSAILRRARRIQEEGMAALRDRAPIGRPRKVTQTELEELHRVVLDRPGMTYPQLRDFVHSRFGVRYSILGLKLLLKRDLAIG
jgi:transposase